MPKQPDVNFTPQPVVADETLINQRRQGLALIGPIKTAVGEISVMTAEEYEGANDLLVRIKKAKGNWLARINPIIEPIKNGLDLLYGLRRDIIDPLDELEEGVKAKMVEFKKQEKLLIQQADMAKVKEEARLASEIRAKEAAEAKAKTIAMQTRLQAQRAALQQSLVSVQAKVAAAPVKVSGSSDRTTKKWRITDWTKFLQHITKGQDLTSLVQVDNVQMNAYFNLNRKDLKVGEWMPGVEVYEETTIAGRK